MSKFKRKLDEPPLVIMLDLLFILLFILFLSEDRQVIVGFSNEDLFKGAVLLYREPGNSGQYRRVTTGDIFIDEESLLVKCESKKACSEAITIYGDNVYVYVPTSVFDVISKITFHAYQSPVSKCGKIYFLIDGLGNVDFDSLYKKNPCLKKIPNLSERYK